MTKRILTFALVLGSMLISSCIKEQESQTVIDLRNAKAEQLNARVVLNNAKAQAATIAAKAEATLLEARSKAENATAAKLAAELAIQVKQNELMALRIEYTKLQLEGQKIANEDAQLELEAALRQLEIDKALAEQELNNIAAQLEVILAELAIQQASAQQDLYAAQQRIVDYEVEKSKGAAIAELAIANSRLSQIQSISSEYASVLSEIHRAQENITYHQGRIVLLENHLLDANMYREELIAKNNAKIAAYRSEIEILKQYEYYPEDLETLRDRQNLLFIKRGKLADQRTQANKAYTNYKNDEL